MSALPTHKSKLTNLTGDFRLLSVEFGQHCQGWHCRDHAGTVKSDTIDFNGDEWGLANFIMAIAELVGAISLSLLALTMPYLAIGVVAVLLGGLVWRLIRLKQIRRETVAPED